MDQEQKNRLISRIAVMTLDWATFAEEQDGSKKSILNPTEIPPPFSRRDGWLQAIMLVGKYYDKHIKWFEPDRLFAYELMCDLHKELVALANRIGNSGLYVMMYGNYHHESRQCGSTRNGVRFHTSAFAVSCAANGVRALVQAYCQHLFAHKRSFSDTDCPGEDWYVCKKCGYIIDVLTEEDNLVPEEEQTE